MASIKYPENISILRSIVRELGKATGKNKEVISKDPSLNHMLDLFRDNRVTEERFCRSPNHYRYYAETYLTYLRSTRLQDEITKKYFSRQERSVEDSARLVGLELPKLSN